MTPTPPNSSAAKRLACSIASLLALALLMLLPRTQHALPPTSRPAHAAALLLRPAARFLPGDHNFWHTRGSLILDAHEHPVSIAGINWSGLETKEAVLGGLEAQDYRAILRAIKSNGFNTVRIPFSNEMIEMPSVPEQIRFENASGPINADLRDRTSLEILDRVIDYAGSIGLKIILDNHRSEAGSSAEESGLWYTEQYPESAWIEDWTRLALRYRSNAAVIGMDLRNEPHNADRGGSCWDCGGPNDWHRAAQRAGNSILSVNPHVLIFIEGVDTYAGDSYWWGGNLEGVRRSPILLSLPNQLVYSAHEYGPAEYAQPWFTATTSPATLASVWQRHWAYISESGMAPVWIGEFGTTNNDSDVESSIPGSEGQWFTTLVTFLDHHPHIGWTYWGVNGEDRYGLLDVRYSGAPASSLKAQALASISSPALASRRNRAVDSPLFVPESASSTPVAFEVQTGLGSAQQSLPLRSAGYIPPVHGFSTIRSIPVPAVKTMTASTDLRTRTDERSTASNIKMAIAASVQNATRAANKATHGEDQ